MSQTNDCKHNALTLLGFDGQVEDQELAWLKSLSIPPNSQLNDAWLSLANGNVGEFNDQVMAYMIAQGAEGGTYSDVSNDFWCNVMGGSFLATHQWFIQSRLINGDGLEPEALGYGLSGLVGSVTFGGLTPATLGAFTVTRFSFNANSDFGALRFSTGGIGETLDIRATLQDGSTGILTWNGAGIYTGNVIGAAAYVTPNLQNTVPVRLEYVPPPPNALTADNGEFLLTDDFQYILAE
jgi:hypothetical protein